MTEEDGLDSNGLLIPKTDFLNALQYCDLPCPEALTLLFAWLKLRRMVKSLVYQSSSKQFCVEITL